MRNKMTTSTRSLSSAIFEHKTGEACAGAHVKPKRAFDPVKELDSLAQDWGIEKSVLLRMTAGITVLKKHERDAERVLSELESERLVVHSLLATKKESDETDPQIAALKWKIEVLTKELEDFLNTQTSCKTAFKEAETRNTAASDRFQKLLKVKNSKTPPQGRKKTELNANFPIAQREKTRSKTDLDKALVAFQNATKNVEDHKYRISELQSKLSKLSDSSKKETNSADVDVLSARLRSVNKRLDTAKENLDISTRAVKAAVEIYIEEHFDDRSADFKRRVSQNLYHLPT